MPFCNSESSSAETACRTANGSRRSFWRTGVASGLTVGLWTKPFTQPTEEFGAVMVSPTTVCTPSGADMASK